MFVMKNFLILFISLAMGYGVCVLAQKQKSVLKTVGYTLGIAMIALALLYGAAESIAGYDMTGKSICGYKAMKCYAGASHMNIRHK